MVNCAHLTSLLLKAFTKTLWVQETGKLFSYWDNLRFLSLSKGKSSKTPACYRYSYQANISQCVTCYSIFPNPYTLFSLSFDSAPKKIKKSKNLSGFLRSWLHECFWRTFIVLSLTSGPSCPVYWTWAFSNTQLLAFCRFSQSSSYLLRWLFLSGELFLPCSDACPSSP